MFWVCGAWGGEDFGKFVEHNQGAQKKYNVYMQIFPTEEEGGTLVSIFRIK